jgi:hypothetical protein
MLPHTLQGAFLMIVLPRIHTGTFKLRYFCQVFENPYSEPHKEELNSVLTVFYVVSRVVYNLQ